MTVDYSTHIPLELPNCHYYTQRISYLFTSRDMNSITVATDNNNRAFNWDDDDEDDFDLDAWKATVDTSAPNVCELGPLQPTPTDHEVEVDETYSCELIQNERALLGTPAPETKDVDISQSLKAFEESEEIPEPEAIDISIEDYDEDFPDCSADDEVASAQYEHIVQAIGPHYEGKEESDTPAYPEFSCDAFQRYRYAKEFQATRYNTARPVAEVYRHSPLVYVISIDEAHLIPDKIRKVAGEVAVAVAEKKIGDCEVRQIVAPEKQELDTQGANEEMDQEINHMLTEQTERGFDVQTRFSKDELEGFFRVWKAQQDDSGDDADAEDVDDGEIEYDDDADSVDTWELSDSDSDSSDEEEEEEEEEEGEETVVEPLGDVEEDDENKVSITRTEEHDTTDSAEELDFNDVVFGREGEGGDGDGESLVRDEGYVSSSPPVSPVVDSFVDECDDDKSCSESGTQRDADPRVDSMYALDEPEATECSAGDDEPTAVAEEVRDAGEAEGYNDAAAETIHGTEAIMMTMPPLEIAKECDVSSPDTAVASPHSFDDGLGITTESSPSTSPASSGIVFQDLESTKQPASKSLLTRTLSNTGALPWTSIGLVTAGALIGGLVGAARRR